MCPQAALVLDKEWALITAVSIGTGPIVSAIFDNTMDDSLQVAATDWFRSFNE